jgi:hypothetical protein
MERLYQHQAYMVEGMYVVGVKPRALGEGLVPVVYTRDYTRAWLYWNQHPGYNYGLFQWSQGTLKWIGRRVVDKKGRTHWVPLPPWHIEISA